MSDVKVTVGADASELEREMNRAASSVERMARRAEMLRTHLGPLSGQMQMLQGRVSSFTTGRITQEMLAANAASTRMGMGVLAMSNAVQDATYGMRGALNNIPQLVMGLGGGMGLAGAAMGAAVAYDLFARKIEESNKAMDAQMEEFAKPSDAMAARAKEAEAAAKTAAYNAAVHQEWLLYEEKSKRMAKETAEARAAAEAKVNESLREQIGLAREAIENTGMDPEALRKKKISGLLEEARTSSMETARRAAPGSLKNSDDLKRLINQVIASGEKIGLTGQLNILNALKEIVKLEDQAKQEETQKATEAERDAAAKKAALDRLHEQLEISRLLAKGETDKAEALRREIALRREAAETAKATGQDEKKVLDQLRERERNMAQGEARKNAKPKRHFNAAESAARRAARLSKTDKDRGRMSNTDKLAEENLRRREEQRADRARAENKNAPGDKILQNILDAEKRQIDLWNGITSKAL